MSLLKVAHVPPATVEGGSTVWEAVRKMADEGVGAVAVVEAGELRGIFTERDVMLRVVLAGRPPNQVKVGEVMTAPAQTASEASTAEEAMSFMVERHIRHLPIVDKNGRLLGMLSVRNLLEHVVENLSRELHSLDQYLLNDGPGG